MVQVGTIMSFLPSSKNCEIIQVKFDFQSDDDIPVPISRMAVNKYCISEGTTITCHRFPLRLAWAVTAHKSQGQTLSKVAINISTLAFAHGAFYVALSRVRSLNDVLLFGVSKWPEKGVDFHNNEFIQFKAEQISMESINSIDNTQSDNESNDDEDGDINIDDMSGGFDEDGGDEGGNEYDEINDDIDNKDIKPNDDEIPPYDSCDE